MDTKTIWIIGGIGLVVMVVALGGSRTTTQTSAGAAWAANNANAIQANIAMGKIGTDYAARMAGIDAQLAQSRMSYDAMFAGSAMDSITSGLAENSRTVQAITAGTINQARAAYARDMATQAGVTDMIKQGMIVVAGVDMTLAGYKNALDLNTQNTNAAIALNADNNSTHFKIVENTNAANIRMTAINNNGATQRAWLQYKTAQTVASAQKDTAIYGTLIRETGATTRQAIKSYYGS